MALALPSRVWSMRLAWPPAPHTLAHVSRSWRISPWLLWWSMVSRFTVSEFTPGQARKSLAIVGWVGRVSETVELDSSRNVLLSSHRCRVQYINKEECCQQWKVHRDIWKNLP